MPSLKGNLQDLREKYGKDILKLLPKMRERADVDRGPLIEADRQGAAAARLLEDGDLQRVLKAVEDHYLNAWRNSAVPEVELREKAHCAIQVLDGIRNKMKADVARGDAAARELDRIANSPK